MKHHASAKFWTAYHALPLDVQKTADKNFAILKADPFSRRISKQRRYRKTLNIKKESSRRLSAMKGGDFIDSASWAYVCAGIKQGSTSHMAMH